MSLQAAFKVIALLVILPVLFFSFLAMGPIGWVGIGLLLVAGVISVHRNRNSDGQKTKPRVQNCPDCGAPNDAEAIDCEHCGGAL